MVTLTAPILGQTFFFVSNLLRRSQSLLCSFSCGLPQ